MGLFATLSTPRSGTLATLARHDEAEAGLRLETVAGVHLEIRLRGGRAHLKVGGSGAIARTFLGRFRAVLFTPEDLDLVRGEPGLRRAALDDLIVQVRPAYRGVRQDFERSLRQRNAALRQGLAEDAAVYNAPLAAAAAQVLESRREAVQSISPHAEEVYALLADRGTMTVRYRERVQAPESGLEAFFLGRYTEDLGQELERGATRAGPHRDDLDIEVDGVSARSYASRGEQRSAALSFRLAELRLLPDAVLLLDDVLSELDAERRHRLFRTVAGTQTIVTTTERDAVPDDAAVEDLWIVREGVLQRAG
jgi:DNA replication and repair protein RecF